MKRQVKLGICAVIFSLSLAFPQLRMTEGAPILEPGGGFGDEEPLISMDFKDVSLKDVLKLLSIQSGLNFVASSSVQERELTLYLDKVPLRQAMDRLFEANNLAYTLDEDANIFIVKDLGPAMVETVTRIFYLKNATVSTSSLKDEMKKIATAGEESPGAGGEDSSGGGGGGGESGGKFTAEAEAGITSIVKKLLTPYGFIIEDYRTNSLIVTDVPSRMPLIVQAIASLDIAVPQILLEVEMLDVSKSSVDRLGIRWGQSPFTISWTGPTHQSLWPVNRFTSSGRSGEITQADTSGTISLNAAGSTYSAALDFLKTQTDTKYLARPRILTLNNEPAEIKITTNEEIGQIVTISGGGEGITSSSTEPERTETGVVLRVVSQVNPETGEITMVLMPSVTDTSASTVSGSTNRNPEKRSTKSIVRIKDGETVIIGGLLRNRVQEVITKMPILGDIPIINFLFKNKTKTPAEDRELVIFVTPHIVKEKSMELAKSPKGLVLPEREQGVAFSSDRFAVVGSSLDEFEKKKR